VALQELNIKMNLMAGLVQTLITVFVIE